MTVEVRIQQYLRSLSAQLKERAAAMLLAESSDEIERLRLTDDERLAIVNKLDKFLADGGWKRTQS